MKLKVDQLDRENLPKRLRGELTKLERQYCMTSLEFYERYRDGALDDSADFVRWAGLCYVAIRHGLLVPSADHA